MYSINSTPLGLYVDSSARCALCAIRVWALYTGAWQALGTHANNCNRRLHLCDSSFVYIQTPTIGGKRQLTPRIIIIDQHPHPLLNHETQWLVQDLTLMRLPFLLRCRCKATKTVNFYTKNA